MPDTCPHCHRLCPDLHTVIYLDAVTHTCAGCLAKLVRDSGRLLDVFIPAPSPTAALAVTS